MNLDRLRDKKVVCIGIISIIIFVISIVTYGRNKENIFKDEYIEKIFVEDDYVEDDINEAFEDDLLDDSNLTNKIVVEIKGEVLNPNVYILNEGSIIKDLIDVSGGLTEEANISNINRAKELQNHELIIIGNKNDKTINESENEIVKTEMYENDGIININTADKNILQKIPGIGEVKAQSIIDYRELNGLFKSIDELKNVDGIGEKTFEKIKEKIKI